MTCRYDSAKKRTALAEGITGVELFTGALMTGDSSAKLDFSGTVSQITDLGNDQYKIETVSSHFIVNDPYTTGKDYAFRDIVTLYKADKSYIAQFSVIDYDEDTYFTVESETDLAALTGTILFRLFTPHISLNYHSDYDDESATSETGLSKYPLLVVMDNYGIPWDDANKAPGYDVKMWNFAIFVIDSLNNHIYDNETEYINELAQMRCEDFCSYRLDFICNKLIQGRFSKTEYIRNFGSSEKVVIKYILANIENYDKLFFTNR